jgi:predicted PurR-regulated permease PerM
VYKDQKISFLIDIVFFGVIAVISYILVKFLLIYLLPFVIGLLVTVVVQKPAAYISCKLSVKKGLCALFLVICLYSAIILAFVGTIYFIGCFLSDVFSGNAAFTDELTDQIYSFTNSLNQIIKKLPEPVANLIPQTSGNLVNELTSYFSDITKRAASAAPMFVTTSVVTVVGSCYIAKDYDRFKYSINSVLSSRIKIAINETKAIINEKIVKLFWGYGKLLLITFGELLIGLFMLKVPNALFLSVIIALLDLLPVFGTGTILVP